MKLEALDDPAVHYSEFLKASMYRLCEIEKPQSFLCNFAFEELAAHAGSFEAFSSFSLEHLVPLYDEAGTLFLELGLKRALFHMAKNSIQSPKTLAGYIDRFRRQEDPTLAKIGDVLAKQSERRPIVFISAETEPFSKSGGLANVLYELPRELVSLGETVYVVTPRYAFGDAKAVAKMQDAIQSRDIRYSGRNVSFQIQQDEYEVGVHTGIVDGVNYFLLDHHEFFDGLYWGVTTEEKLRRRIALARSAC